jgi:hypothetical protein
VGEKENKKNKANEAGTTGQSCRSNSVSEDALWEAIPLWAATGFAVPSPNPLTEPLNFNPRRDWLRCWEWKVREEGERKRMSCVGRLAVGQKVDLVQLTLIVGHPSLFAACKRSEQRRMTDYY